MREWTGWDVSKNAYQKQNEEGFDEEKVSLLSKMISRSQISISECRFKSPRLNQQLSCIQALALGEESPQTIEDDTSRLHILQNNYCRYIFDKNLIHDDLFSQAQKYRNLKNEYYSLLVFTQLYILQY